MSILNRYISLLIESFSKNRKVGYKTIERNGTLARPDGSIELVSGELVFPDETLEVQDDGVWRFFKDKNTGDKISLVIEDY